MGTYDLDAVHHDGARALCRFMCIEHGFAIPTMHSGGWSVHYRKVSSALWKRLKQRQAAGRGGRSGALGGWPSSVNAAEIKTIWCSLVRALSLVEERPF